MNALVSIDTILSPVTIDQALTPAIVFAPGGVEAIISKIEAEVSTEVFTLDTAEGRERIKSVAYKVARSKTALDDMGKELVAGIKAQAGAIDADRRTIRDRLDALKEKVRGPLTAWEEAEAARVEGAETALVFITTAARWEVTPAAEQIRNQIQSVRDVLADHDWQEFRERADAAAADVMPALERMLAAAEQAERDASELAELRKLKAEREEADRLAAIAAEAAEKARQEAEQKAAREAEQAAQAAERYRQRQEQAEKDKAAAVAAAIEQERRRQENEAAQERRRQEAEAAAAAAKKAAEEAAERKRQSDAINRARVHAEMVDALIVAGFGVKTARDVVTFTAAGNLPHVSITY